MSKKLIKSATILGLLCAAGVALAACGQQGGQSSSVPAASSSIVVEEVVWQGVEDLDLDMGDPAPDLLEGVSATQGNAVLTVKIDTERSDELNMDAAGAYSIYYVAYLGETAISEEDGGEYIRTVIVNRGTYIDNSDFSTSSKAGWTGNGNGNSEMSWDINPEISALVVNITKSGDEYWQNQVEFNGLSVKAGVTYEINIRAKSDSPRNIGASLEVPSLGYRCIDTVSVNSVGYTMTNEYADYKFYYTASEDYDGVKFGIILGRFNELDEGTNAVFIDSVKVSKAAKVANSTGVVFTGETSVEVNSLADYEALDPVTAVDRDGNPVELVREGAVQTVEFAEELGKATFGEMWKYVDGEGNLSYFRRQINYKAPAPERLGEYDTLDGNFEYGVKFWTPEENGIVKIEANKEEQTVEISSVKDAPSGEADWRGQLQQNNNGGKLTANHAYKMVVEAKIDNINVTTLRAEFCAGGGNAAAKKDMVFDAADTYQTFETDVFQPTKDVTGGDYRVGLLIGEYSEAYHLTVKSIHVVEVEADIPYIRETVYEVMNGDFEMGLKYWVKEENNTIAITDNEDGTVKIASVVDSHLEADWTAQLQQNNNGGILEAGHSYKATVTAKTNNVALTTLRLEFAAGANNPNAKVDLAFTAADTYQTFETAVFTPAEEVNGGNYRVGLLLGEFASGYELTVDEISIVELE
ncbi:MAG: carbohydrate binding domain-containing protein [Bacilli bacterium]|nr:carbohydrate binding domain-containing protein [Bacilli bacterium]